MDMARHARKQDSPAPERYTRKDLLFLLLLILLGLLIRMHGLGTDSLWLDEGIVLQEVRHNSLTSFLSGRAHFPGHPPLGLAAWKVWTLILGGGPATARLFSVIIGTCTIAGVYVLGRELIGRWPASIATVLISLSTYHSIYSQDISDYALLGLEVVLALFLFQRVSTSSKPAYAVAFAIINLLGLYTHVFYLYVVGTHLLAAMVFCKDVKVRRIIIAAVVLPLLLFSPWLFRMMATEWHIKGGSYSERFTIGRFIPIMGEFIGFSGVENQPSGILYLPMVILIIASLIERRKRRGTWMLAFYFLAPVLIHLLLETVVGPVLAASYGMQSRYLIIIYPAFVLLLAGSIAVFSKPATAGLLLILLIPSLVSMQSPSLGQYSEDWKGAAAYLSTRYGLQDQKAVVPSFLILPLSVYLPEGWPHSLDEAVQLDYKMTDEVNPAFLQGLPQEFVLVTSYRHLKGVDPEDRLWGYLSAEYVLEEGKDFQEVTVQHYTKRTGE